MRHSKWGFTVQLDGPPARGRWQVAVFNNKTRRTKEKKRTRTKSGYRFNCLKDGNIGTGTGCVCLGHALSHHGSMQGTISTSPEGSHN